MVDSTTALDLTEHAPLIALRTRGRRLWDTFVEDPPYWWTDADIPAAAMLCAATDATGAALTSTETSAAGKAALLKEWRSLADQLGLTPTSRGRMKLTEGQAVVAASKVEAMEAKRGDRRRSEAMDLDELTDG